MRHDTHFVEQLFRSEELTLGRRIPVSLIDPNPDQPRSVLGDLTDLKGSISRHGILEPILVRRRDAERFTIISGERRYRAAVDVGLTDVPCIEMDVDDARLLEIALIENLQRKDLTPFEEGDGYALLRDQHGYSHEKIAQTVGKSRVTVTETLRLLELPQIVLDECRRADIVSKSFLLELSRLPTEPSMLQAIEAWKDGQGRSRDVLREARKEPATKTAGGASRSMPKRFELSWAPDGAPYRVRVVLHGSLTEREEILQAVRDLLRKIDAGEVDLVGAGRFTRLREAPRDATDKC